MRCKGFFQLVEAPQERTLVQAVGRRVSLTSLGPWEQTPTGADLVVIGAKGSLETDDLQQQLDSCRGGRPRDAEQPHR